MRMVCTADIRRLDESARATAWAESLAMRPRALMDAAALAVADETCEIAAHMKVKPEIWAVCGKGDNGEDARISASILASRGFSTRTLSVADSSGDEFEQFNRPPCAFPRGSIILDGILGIGLSGAPRGAAESAINFVSRMRSSGRAVVIAVDVPSGLDADAGAIPGVCVKADFTVSMGLPKKGFAKPAALEKCGEIIVADIGYPFPISCDSHANAQIELFSTVDAETVLPPRAWASNKGDFGHVAIVAGSERYSGAGALAALGALRGGAGLVTAFAPSVVSSSLASISPELMVRSFPEPVVTPSSLAATGFDFSGKVILAGCGLSRESRVGDALSWLFSTPGIRGAVLDADALFFLPSMSFPAQDGIPLVLTPHLGEAARLLGSSVREVQSDRVGAAREIASRWNAVAILKGAGTLVASPGGRLSVVSCGNPALAKGGSGDLLAGLVAAHLARGLPAFEAACLAVWRHGRAADLAVLSRGAEATLPSDLLSCLK